MAKKKSSIKNQLIQQSNDKPLAVEQKMQIELIESEIKQTIKELNTLPRITISAFLIPFMARFLFRDFFAEWESWLSKLFIKLQLLSDEMDPLILNMTTDYLEAKNVIEGFTRGDLKAEYVIGQIKTFCQQITQSPLLKKLNFNLERLLRFTQECRFDFASMSVQELQQSYKIISDKYRVVQSISVEDLLSLANKQQIFSSITGVLFYQLVTKNTVDPLFDSIISYSVFYSTERLMDNESKLNLNHDSAKTYIEKLTKQKNRLNHHYAFQQIFFRLLILSLLVFYFLFGVGQAQIGLLFFGLINMAFAGLSQEIKRFYQQFNKYQMDQKNRNVLKLILSQLNCYIEQKTINEKTYFVVRFSAKQVISEEEYPISSYHIIRQLLKLLREHKIKALHDKKNTMVIDGSFLLSDTKSRLVQTQLQAIIKKFSSLYDGIKKIKKTTAAMRIFGVDDVFFINDSVQGRAAVKFHFSLLLPEAVEKMQQMILLLSGKELSIFDCYNQAYIGEFLLDEAISSVSYLSALSKIEEWKKQKKAMLKVAVTYAEQPENEISSAKKARKKTIKLNQVREIVPEKQYHNISWQSGRYNDSKIYPLHGRGIPEGRYFITARLTHDRKINEETVNKILRTMKQGKIASKRGEPGVQLVRKEKGASRHFEKFSYFAKVKTRASGGVGEPRGICTEVVKSQDQNHVLYVLTDICKKVH